MDTLELISLLSSRLCHDLVGPVGAVVNGLEILADEPDPDMRRRAIDLMVKSAGEASRRLKFYRLAFGASGGDGLSIELDQARDAAVGLFEESKISLEWPAVSTSTDPRAENIFKKLLLNMILVGSEALARGGTLSVEITKGAAGFDLLVTANGAGASLSDDTLRLLAGREDLIEIGPRSVQPFFTWQLAQALGSQIDVSSPEVGRVEISAVVAFSDGG